MSKREVAEEIFGIMSENCHPCNIYSEYGDQRKAERFCLYKCSVGAEIQQLGKKYERVS